MRKFLALCSFLCGVIFAGGAYAADKADCYAETNDAFGINGARAIKVFFDADKVNAKDGCDTFFNNLKNSLGNLVTNQDIAGFVVLGSASLSNSTHQAETDLCKNKLTQKGNIALACDRAEFVLKNIIPDSVKGADMVLHGGRWAWALRDKKVLVLNMSDTNDRTYFNDMGDANNQTEISTTVLVLPKGVTCNDSEELKNAQIIMEKYKSDSKFPAVCNEVLTFCPDADKLKLVTREQFGKIEKCMGELALVFDTGDWDLWVKIDGLYKKLDGLLAGLSVWKNAEGKFNTSRLLSDSVAAVVLGTTSGVITSTLVKKNQIKKGFESLRCMVGGQPVADYGDEFVVGATATAYSR